MAAKVRRYNSKLCICDKIDPSGAVELKQV